MRNKSLLAITPFAFALFTASALADEMPAFQEADKDGDGVLSHTEAEEALPIEIPDLNGDGIVRVNEIVEVLPDIGFAADDTSPVMAGEYYVIVETLRNDDRYREDS